MQETSYQGKLKNASRVNQISPEQDALAEARRDCRKKHDYEGFDEYYGGQSLDNRFGDCLNIPALLDNLPSSFALYKPANNLFECAGLLKKLRAKDPNVFYTVKRNGEAFWAVIGEGNEITFYSRRARKWNDHEGPTELPDGTLDFSTVVPWSTRFQYLVQEIQYLSFPPWTMLAGELCLWEPGKGDNFDLVSGYTKSLTPRALADMAQHGWPTYYAWDLPFYAGQNLISNYPPGARWAKLHEHLRPGQYIRYVHPLTILSSAEYASPEDAQEIAKRQYFEGFVVVDATGVYGDRGCNLTGKPDRPGQFCAKLKPHFEGDFVAFFDPDQGAGEWGYGRHERGKLVTLPSGEQVIHGGVGSVALYQYNARGELVYISNCAGIEYEMQAKLHPEHFPQVWQVEYASRKYVSEGEKTNSLTFPRFSRLRTDKRPEECINEKL
jgi:hypothetical protein